MKAFIDFILLIWQLPQNIIGFVIAIVTNFIVDPRGYYIWNLRSGISLGNFIFLPENCSDITIHHEQGHQVQSKYLGPLYLIIIGIPSFVWATIYMFVKLFNKDLNYYSFYTEKWADKLGGVER